MKRTLTILVLSCVFAICASAQRTAPGSSALSFTADFSFTSGGFAINYNRYTQLGFIKAGASAVDHRGQLNTGETFSWPHIVATGDYLFRMAGTRSKSFNVYGGGGAYVGCELADIFNEIPATTVTSVKGNRVIIGLDVQVELEWFFSKRTALIAVGRCPFDFLSAVKKINPEVGLGIKYNF